MHAVSEEISHAQIATAMRTPDQLKRFLIESGREYLVLHTSDLVDGLAWPEGVVGLQQILNAYAKHRENTPTGECETITNLRGEQVTVPRYKSDQLSRAELEACIGHLKAKLAQLK